MYCNNCGKEIDDKAAVCPYCGCVANKNALNSTRTPKETNTLAIVGFILSFFIAIAGLICSIIGYKKSDELSGSGKGLAIAGIVISSIAIVATVLSIIIIIAGIAAIA